MLELVHTIGLLLGVGTIYIGIVGITARIFYNMPQSEENTVPHWDKACSADYRSVLGQISITSSRDVFDYVHPIIGAKHCEHLLILLVNSSNNVIAEIECTDNIPGYVRFPDINLIVNWCLQFGVNKVIMAHNHPGGNLYPSSEDIYYTAGLSRKLWEFGISIKDHLIISRESYCSIRDNDVWSMACCLG